MPPSACRDRSDLLNAKALSLHGIAAWPPGRTAPQNSLSKWTQRWLRSALPPARVLQLFAKNLLDVSTDHAQRNSYPLRSSPV